MLVLSAENIRALAPMPELIKCLEEAFRTKYVVPARQVTEMPGGADNRLFISMPVFDPKGSAAVKLATYFPGNSANGLPTIQAAIVVFSEIGSPVAILDGTIVTRIRTGAASALASKYLSRADSTHLVIIGTGALAPYMAEAHCSVRAMARISICGRSLERAAATVATIRSLVSQNIEVNVSNLVDGVVTTADIVSCCTASPTPVLAGKWLRPGTFVDLVGGFSPSKREADDDVALRSRIFVDTIEGALAEAGDILDPLQRGVIKLRDIQGELADLVCGRIAERRTSEEITLFKSVGTAIEDLATAQLVVRRAASRVES